MITCFNRDIDGKCLAYNGVECSKNCKARIVRIEDKIALLECLLRMSQANKDRRRLTKELKAAEAVREAQRQKRYEDWMKCYMDDIHRGEKGGASESDSNRKTGMKQLMKDNRPVGIKPTKSQQEEYRKALKDFEEQVGEKMEKLSRTGISRSKIDSYTGIPICFIDSGMGHCRGQQSAGGRIGKECRECSYFKEGV